MITSSARKLRAVPFPEPTLNVVFPKIPILKLLDKIADYYERVSRQHIVTPLSAFFRLWNAPVL
ncbi:MAG: hypothetical protein HY429_00275 [Candidatus Levybacteria bacterium]|nr:hypothetical protein [Candidatus Levybacteria bacterium]